MMVGKVYRNIIFAQLGISILSLLSSNIDNIIVGKFMGAESLAACGLVAPVVAIVSVLAAVITAGIKTVCSQSIGAGKKKQANDQIATAAVFSLILFTLLCTLCYVFLDPISYALAGSQGAGFVQLVKDYMMGYLLVIPLLGILSLFIYVLQANNRRVFVTIAAVVFIVANIALDLTNIFYLKWGLFGIGISTVVSYLIMIIIMIVGHARVNATLKVTLKGFNGMYFGKILKEGLPNAIAGGSAVVIQMIVNIVMLTTSGVDALAAVTVLVAYAGILFTFGNAIAYCTRMSTEMFFNERNVKELMHTIGVFVRYSVIMNVIVSALVFIFAEWLCLLFLNIDEFAYYLASDALRVFSICLIFYSLSNCFVYYFTGVKKAGLSNLTALLMNVALGVFSAIYIPQYMVNGAAVAYVLAYVAVFLLLVICFTIKNKKNPFTSKNYVLVPKGFEIEDKYIFECSPKNEDELIKDSKRAGEFGKKFEDNIHNRMAISLAIEELGVNIFEHGIKNKKDYIFDIRLVYDKETKGWILRVRDDCAAFNPVKFLELHESKDKTKNLGLRLVLSIVKNADYYNTMGLNNLVVEF